MQLQIFDAMRETDAVVLVLSESSINSDWVENELEMARKMEKLQERDVLCPVALDDSWKEKMAPTEPNRAVWLPLQQKLVLDFSKKTFTEQFDKLLRGLKIYYKPESDSAPDT